MKIAFVIDIYEDCGNGTSVSAQRFVQGIRARGHEVVILCTAKSPVTEPYVVGFDVKVIPFFQGIIEKQHALLAQPDDDKIRQTIKDVDVVHIYMPFWLGTHSARIASELGIPVLGCYHISAENLVFNAGMKYLPASKEIVYSMLKLMHYREKWIKDIYCPSRCIAGTILKYHYKQNLHIISNGYDPDFCLTPSEKPEKYKDKFVVVSVGRLTEEKRQDLIIRAVAHSKYKNKIVLILAGKGPKEGVYRTLSTLLGVNLEIVFLNKAELITLLNYADLFVQASDVETESVSCLEAIACGVVPIISNARMCATKQFALTGNSIFKKGNPYNLASKINLWLEYPELRKTKSLEYAEYAKRFSLKNSIDSVLSVYENMRLKKSDNYYTIRDYNNPLNVEIPLDDNGVPNKEFRKMLKGVYSLFTK